MSELFRLEFPQSVGVFQTYDEAQKVVDYLADSHFPVENLCIVGTDLRSVERVLGRRTWGSVIGRGVQTGLTTGIMVTILMFLFMPNENFFTLFATALGIGIVIGIAMSAIGYWTSHGKRDFTSVSQTIATHYEVLSEHRVVGKARELLASMPGARAAAFAPQAYGASTPYAAQPSYQPQPQPYQAQPQPYYQQPYPPQPYQGQPYPGQVPPGYPPMGFQQWAYPPDVAPAQMPPAQPPEDSSPTPPEDR